MLAKLQYPSSTHVICEYPAGKNIEGIDQVIIGIGQQVPIHVKHGAD
jgi:hypothetical protein